MKRAGEEVDPLAFLSWRFILAAACLFAVLRLRGLPLRIGYPGLVDKPLLQFKPDTSRDMLLERRSVWFAGWVDCPVYQRDAMPAGFAFDGPAIVEEEGGTSVLPPGWSARVHASGARRCSAPAVGT